MTAAVSEALQLEEVRELHDTPRLLVEWSPRWEDFFTSIGPALARSDARLAGEAPFGLQPIRNLLVVCSAEAFVVFLAIIVPIKLNQLHPYIAPKLTGHEIIYYSGDELPRTEDLGGTHTGGAGTAGGLDAHHRTQTIRVARGGSLVEKVLDAPRLKLPASPDAVANLLAIHPDAGPPPTEGLHSARTAPNLPSSVIAPLPNVSGDLSRSAVLLAPVIPPAPSVSRDHVLYAPPLSPTVIAPAPTVSTDHTRSTPLIATNVVPPAPDVRAGDKPRSLPSPTPSVVPPAPAVSRDISHQPAQMVTTAVIAPPVSAPVRTDIRNPKLAMPAPAVVAPPVEISQDLHRPASNGSVPELSKTVVPPPPSSAASTSFMSSLLNRVFGSSSGAPAVVAPPPTVSGTTSSRAASGSISATVVPPPPAISASGDTSSEAKRPSLATKVVPPPPAASTLGGRSAANSATPATVVPPPPSFDKGTSIASAGRGLNGAGLGSQLDAGLAVAPPRNSGSVADSGVVVSKDPGPKVGLPANAKPGLLAMSPAGGDKPGLGGSGGGSGLVQGAGPGSALNGEGVGGGKIGSGRGSDPAAKAGISPTPGPGGAGNATSGNPAVPGVSVAGGSTYTVDFGSSVGAGNPNLPGRSSVKGNQNLGITVQSTASSGGAFDFYHLMPDATSHDVYIFDTSLPTVMRYSDPAVAHSAGSLAGPEPLHTDLPAGLPHARLVITCVLDASGSLKNLHVYEAGPADMTAKVMAALPGWKFTPAMIGDQPVEVNAILGFNIDTNDRK